MKIAKSVGIFLVVFLSNQVHSEETTGNITTNKPPNKLILYTKNDLKTESNTTHVNQTANANPRNNYVNKNSTSSKYSEGTSQTNKYDSKTLSNSQGNITEYSSKVSSNRTSSSNDTSTTDAKIFIDSGENVTESSPFDNWSASNSSNFKYIMQNDESTDTEVQSLLESPKYSENDLAHVEPQHKYKDDDAIDPSIIMLDNSINFANLEGPKRNKMSRSPSSRLESAGLVPGTLAAIFAGTFLVVSIIGYVMLLSWRRHLENRYGNREMLVDDDYCEKMTDLEHFSI